MQSLGIICLHLLRTMYVPQELAVYPFKNLYLFDLSFFDAIFCTTLGTGFCDAVLGLDLSASQLMARKKHLVPGEDFITFLYELFKLPRPVTHLKMRHENSKFLQTV